MPQTVNTPVSRGFNINTAIDEAAAPPITYAGGTHIQTGSAGGAEKLLLTQPRVRLFHALISHQTLDENLQHRTLYLH